MSPRRTILTACLLAWPLLSCSPEKTAGPSPPPAPPGAFLPLHVGDVWIYRDLWPGNDRNDTTEVTGIRREGDRDYFVLQDHWEHGIVVETLLRSEGDSLIYGYIQGRDRLYADFTASPFESWGEDCVHMGYVRPSPDSVDTPAGTFRDVFVISYDYCRDIADDEARATYARGVGPVSIIMYGSGRLLESAFVGGSQVP